MLALFPLAGGCLQQQSSLSGETPVSITQGDAQQNDDDSQPLQQENDAAFVSAESGVSDAPTKQVPSERPLPPGIRPTEALSTLIRLAQSNVDESILLSYVTNSAGGFGLGPEEIIYLNDIGVPGVVVSAMLQHDHLRVDSAAEADRRGVTAASEAPPLLPPAPEQTQPPQDYISDNPPAPEETVPFEGNFYDTLAPYGTWVDVEGSGRCWQPSVVTLNPGWRPYCDRGHWAYTDCGWYWASDYSWGWAPFHYGRWFRHSRLGWCWAPDNVWGPSWVSWRYSNDYCGWAPLPPVAHFRPGLGFSYHGHSVGFNFNFGILPSCYTFVPVKKFCDPRLSHHILPHDHVIKIFHTTVAANKIVGDHNRIANYGIPAERIAAATHTHVRQVTVQQASGYSFAANRNTQPGRDAPVVRNSSSSQLTQTASPRREIAIDPAHSAPLIVRTPVNQTGHSETPAKTQAIARDTGRKDSDESQMLHRWSPNVSRRIAPEGSSAPLVIHRSTSSRSGSVPNAAVRPAAATPVERAATQRPRSQTHSSFSLTPPRAVEGRPRYERPETTYPATSPPSEAQSAFRASPPAMISQASPAYTAGYGHSSRLEAPRSEMVPSRAPQAALYHHDTVQTRQSQAGSAQPQTPAHLPSAPKATSSLNRSSSEKRGR